ncbi:MAG: FG-GAP repeat protein, partial [bacterium]
MKTVTMISILLMLFLQNSIHAQINEFKINANDGAQDDYFGISVSIAGDYAIVGAYQDDDLGNNSGSAYIFMRNASSWNQQIKLTASDGAANDRFGNSVSISGEYAIIGAHQDNDHGSYSGSAYIFKREGANWIQQTKITASDGGEYDEFGGAVSISGNYAIIGAQYDSDVGNSSGSAYIFRRDGIYWIQEAKITADDLYTDWDFFGHSVSISGDYAVAGARGRGNNHGAAYVYKRDGTSWTQQAILAPSDLVSHDRFGYSVSISGDYVIAGVPNDDDKGNASGSVYIFKRDGLNWPQQAKLTAGDGGVDNLFGWSVSLSENICMVGAPGDEDNGYNSGSAYILRRNGNIWSEEVKLTASDGATFDEFGESVSLTSNYAIAGASKDDVNGNESGSAYLYEQFISGLTGNDIFNMLTNYNLPQNYPNPF